MRMTLENDRDYLDHLRVKVGSIPAIRRMSARRFMMLVLGRDPGPIARIRYKMNGERGYLCAGDDFVFETAINIKVVDNIDA